MNTRTPFFAWLPRVPSVARLLVLLLLAGPAWAANPPTSPGGGAAPSLAGALNPDGTLRAGATGSFSAQGFRMHTAPDGKPVFRPAHVAGAGDQNWQDGFGPHSSPDNGVYATIVAPNGDVYIGGNFQNIGLVRANSVARWDGTAWNSLGSGMNDVVASLAMDSNGNVYAAGGFTTAGGASANRVAKWNGTAWSSLGAGLNGFAMATAVDNSGNLYVGGNFTTAGSVAVPGLAKWNGTAWSSLGRPTNPSSSDPAAVLALAIDGSGNLYASWSYNASQFYVYSVSKWNGSTWNDISRDTMIGTNGPVYALVVDNGGNLFAGGIFGFINGVAANSIAKWNGSTWRALGAGTNLHVWSLAVDGSNNILAAGDFTRAGGISANRIAKWNGTSWSTFGTGLGGHVNVLAIDGSGNVYAGGSFAAAGGSSAHRIAKWNGTAWGRLNNGVEGQGVDARVRALAVDGIGNVYVGGDFVIAGSVAANYIAKWDGTAWSALGTGLDSGVSALAVDGSGNVYAAGGFRNAGSISAERIAKWNGTAWSALGTGLNDNVHVLACDGSGNLYAGGTFNVAGGVVANKIAKWNGSSWSALGAGMNSDVLTLAVSGGDVYAGGSFTTAGGASANRVAKWNGAAWSSLGTGMPSGGVGALVVDGSGNVYAGGHFTTAGGTAASNIAKWNGAAWSALGSGISGASSLAMDGIGNVYAGLGFTIGGTASSNIAKWDGTAWSTLGTGLNGTVFALCATAGGKVYAGGEFTAVGDGSKATLRFGIYEPAPGTAWTGGVSTDWFATGNWTAGVPIPTLDITVPAGAPRYPVIASGTAQARDLALVAGASLTLTGGTLNVGGQFTNSGTFAAPGGTVDFTGALAQGLSGSSTTRFWNLRIGAAGAALGGPVAVQRLLTLDGNLATNGHALTLESTPALTALVVNSGGAVVGDATVQRAIDPAANPGRGYRHYASPVQGSTVADLATPGFAPVVSGAYNSSPAPHLVTPFPTVFGYDQARLTLANSMPAFDKGFFSPAALTDPLVVGRGYTVSLDAAQLVDFVGTLNNGDVPLMLARNAPGTANGADAGWQFVGNPYPAPLDYSLVAPADRVNLDAAIYVYGSTSQYGGQYRAYVNGVGGNPVLPVAQGFFARVSAGQTSGALTFRNSQRLTVPDATAFQRGASDTRPLVQLELRGATGLADAAYVYFENGATAGVDARFDAVKLPNPSGLNLAVWAGVQPLAISGLPVPVVGAVTVPLVIGLPATGTYTLHAAQVVNFGAGAQPFLRDRQLNTLTDLRLQPTYTFTLNAANTTPRFELVFGPQQVLGTALAALAAQVVVFPNPASKAVLVELPAALGRQAVTAALVDALGRVVQQQVLPAGGATHTLPLSNLATGVYALRLHTAAGVVVKKLVVE